MGSLVGVRTLTKIAALAAALGLVVGMLTASPALASAHPPTPAGRHGPHGGPRSGSALAHAPGALRAAVRRVLGDRAIPARHAVQANAESPQAELDDPGATSGDSFGYSVAISGSTAVVGADGANSGTGAAYVFTRSGSTWSQQAELTASDGAQNDSFGLSVAISGSTIVVSAPYHNYQAGAVYVFTRSGTVWTQQAELADPGNTEDDYFGWAVAISGATAVVTANGVNTFTGTAYVFTGSGGTWSEQAELTPSDIGQFDYFGNTVGVSGSTAVVSANSTNSGLGAAYIYARTGTTWAQQAELTDPGASADDAFANSVAVCGSTVVVGAPGVSSGTGAAYVYTRLGSQWSQQAELTAADGAPDDFFGYSVAISGSTAVAGAVGYAFAGAAYSFTRSGTTWIQEAELTAADSQTGDYFAWAVAVSGATVLAGAPQADSSDGTAYVFALPPAPAKLTAAGTATADHFGYSVAVSGATAVVGAYGVHAGTGAVYVFTRSGGIWSEQAELTAADGAAGDSFGGSVAISGSTVVVGAPGRGSGAGAAYVFTRSGTTWSQQAELTAAAGEALGSSVAVSGGTAVVGADGTSGTGAAYVFTRSGTTWSQRAELADPGATAGDDFGYSVALSGPAAVVGAPGSGSGTGAAYVFTRSGTTWPQQAGLTAPDGAAGDYFGWSVAISGTTAVVGADGNDSFTGAAYVFTGLGGTWSEQAELADPGGAEYDYFGSSVAVSGTTAVVGAYGSDAGAGAAYVFSGPGGSWTPQRGLSASQTAAGGDFGWSVAASGTTAVASALGRNSRTGTIGTTYIFAKA
jgi:FG-GAP repeat